MLRYASGWFSGLKDTERPLLCVKSKLKDLQAGSVWFSGLKVRPSHCCVNPPAEDPVFPDTLHRPTTSTRTSTETW